ncbi:hypothetical protein HDU98_007411 [Podochytrium sp. JEL0797]|nr:hypothetical protein HDU98_007411 [Podochytrium sp. JEL0797]
MNLCSGNNDAVSASALLASVYPLDADHPSPSTHMLEGLGSDQFPVLLADDKSTPADRNNEVISISSSPVYQARPLGNVISLYSEASLSSPVSDVIVPEETVEEMDVSLPSQLETDARYQHAVLLAHTLKRRLAYAAYKVQNGWEHESFENVRKWTDEKYDKLSDYKKKKAAVLAKKKLSLFVDVDRLSGGKGSVMGKATIVASQKSSPVSDSLVKSGISKKVTRASSVVEENADRVAGSRKKAKSDALNEDVMPSALDKSTAGGKKPASDSPSQPVHQKPMSVPARIQQQQPPPVAAPPRQTPTATAHNPAHSMPPKVQQHPSQPQQPQPQQQQQLQKPSTASTSSSAYNQPAVFRGPPARPVVYGFQQAPQHQSRPLGPPALYQQEPRSDPQLNTTWLSQVELGPYSGSPVSSSNYPPPHSQQYRPPTSAGYPAAYQRNPYANPYELASPYGSGYKYGPPPHSQYRPDPRGTPQPSPYASNSNPPRNSQPPSYPPSSNPYGQLPNGGGSGILFSQGGDGSPTSARLFSSGVASYPPPQSYAPYVPPARPTNDPIRDFRNMYGASAASSGQYQQLPQSRAGEGYR